MKRGKNKLTDLHYAGSPRNSPLASPSASSPFSFPASRLSFPPFPPQAHPDLRSPSLPYADSPARLVRYQFETQPRYPPDSPKKSSLSPHTVYERLSILEANARVRSLPVTGRPSAMQKSPENRDTIAAVGVRTRTGAVHGKRKRVNQDCAVLLHSFASEPDTTLLGVFDGHGAFGHLVADFLRKVVPETVKSYLSRGSREGVYQRAVKDGIELAAEQLTRNTAINSAYSGSTAIVLLQRGPLLVCGNVGDSRGVVGRRLGSEHGVWSAVQLSRDHKPGIAEERRRIEAAGGRVGQSKNGEGVAIGPLRVWLKNECFPGLAMSRSIGDSIASQIGVTCEAEVTCHELTPWDKFILLASDGVWEVLSSEEVSAIQSVAVVGTLWESGGVEKASDGLMKEVVRRWKGGGIEDVSDDITFVLAFF